MATYRAAQWISDDGQSELVLTSQEDSARGDDELMALARAECQGAAEIELDEDGDPIDGRILIGEWTDSDMEDDESD